MHANLDAEKTVDGIVSDVLKGGVWNREGEVAKLQLSIDSNRQLVADFALPNGKRRKWQLSLEQLLELMYWDLLREQQVTVMMLPIANVVLEEIKG